MALPNALAQAMAMHQSLVPSAERSQYAEHKQTWAPSSGAAGEDITTADQIASFGKNATLAFAAYHAGPNVLEYINRNLNQSTTIQNWHLDRGAFNATSVGDVLSINTGREALKRIRSNTLLNLSELTNIDFRDQADNMNRANAWYSGLKKIEQSGLDLPIFDNVLKLFTRATYLTDVLSYSVERKGQTVLNISSDALGFRSRDRTLDFYAKQLNPFGTDEGHRQLRRTLDLHDYLVFEGGDVFSGELDRHGQIQRGRQIGVFERDAIDAATGKKGKFTAAKKARLVDKGKYTEGVLQILDPSLGMKNPVTGGTYAEKIGGAEGHILMSADAIDPKMTGLLEKASKLPGLQFINATPQRLQTLSNAALMSEGYATMALARTSNLLSEMFNEVGNFFEYIHPEAKKSIYSKMYKKGLVPRMQHGHAFAMLNRYAAIGTGIALGLASINQVGYSMQHGNAVESTGAGLIQTASLALAGSWIAKKAGKSTAVGGAIGFALGATGMAGFGPFAGGTIPGVANVFARANEIRSYVGEVTQMNRLRRNVEEMMPGGTGILPAMGVGLIAASAYVGASRYMNRDTIVENSHRLDYFKGRFGNDPNTSLATMRARIQQDTARLVETKRRHAEQLANVSGRENLQRAQELHRAELAQIRDNGPARDLHDVRRRQKIDNMSEKQMGRIEEEFLSYADKLDKEGEFGLLNNKIGKSMDQSNFNKVAETITDFAYEKTRQKIIMETKGPLLKGMKDRLMKAMQFATRMKAIGYGAVAFGGAYFLATGGLGTTETPTELRELNQGKRLEAVRRGQKWEMGQGGYEGDDVLYYRPTLTARLASGAAQAGASGNHGPLEELILKNFTYKLERENYWKRPAPITGGAFDQVPFIYPFIQPIADLIKKPKLMHVSEWSKSAGGTTNLLERSTGLEEIPDPATGGTAMAAPYSPYGAGRVLGRFWQQTTALSGLVGYFGRTAKAALTGTPGFANQRQELESFSQNTDMASRFYDLHGGGSFLGVPMTSEIVRRFLHPNEVKQYNPIKNDMPSWLPDSFKFGNQYTGLGHGGGEYRMPGEGYQALHPELKGINPEDYPLLHKLNILGDLAPYSPQYKFAKKQADLMQAGGDMTSEEMGFYSRHKQQVKNRLEKRQFDNYQFKPSSYDSIGGEVSSVDASSMTFTIKGYGGRFGVAGISNDTGALISDYNLSIQEAAKQRVANGQAFASKIEVGESVSLVVPASIGQAVDDTGVIKAAITNNGFNVNKDIRESGNFAKDDSPIANYAMTNQAGKMIARTWEAGTHFANRMAQPIEHLGMFGAAPINKLLPFRDVLEDYEAREVYGTEMKDWTSPVSDWIAPALRTAAHNYLGMDFEAPGLAKKRDTEEYFDKLKYYKYDQLSQAAEMSGNPYLSNQYENIAQSTAFGSSGFVSQDRLGNLLGGREAMFASGFANEYNPNRQEDIIDALPDFKQHLLKNYYLNQDLQGIERAAAAGPMSTTGMDYAANLTNLKRNQGYEDASSPQDAQAQRSQELSQYFESKYIPKVDWIGFNPAVDLEDVKLKYIESEGMDYHDFGIYPSRASYLPRKPYINEQLVTELNSSSFVNPMEALGRVGSAFNSYGINSYNIQGPTRSQSFVSFNVNQQHSIDPFQ